MNLQTLDIPTLLNAAIQTHLRVNLSYADLRTKCLSLTPIQAILDTVFNQLDIACAQDKALQRSALTEQAYQRQKTQDDRDHAHDQTQRSEEAAERSRLVRELEDISRQIGSAFLFYPAHMYHLQNPRDPISAHAINVTHLESRQRTKQSRLRDLDTSSRTLDTRAHDRSMRARERSLSADQAMRLTTEIRTIETIIDQQCSAMKQETRTSCYTSFINQLRQSLDGLPLSLDEKRALAELIIKMNEHMAALTQRREISNILREHEARLSQLQEAYTQRIQHVQRMHSENRSIENDNDFLGAQLRIREQAMDQYVTQRNTMGLYTLITSTITTLAATASYFLIQAGLIAPLMPLIVVAVGCLASLALLLTTATYFFCALYQRSKYNSAQETLDNNTRKRRDNLATLENDPRVASQQTTEFHTCQGQIQHDRVAVEQAQRHVDRTWNEANAITCAGNLYAFFDASVPSAPPLNAYTGCETGLTYSSV